MNSIKQIEVIYANRIVGRLAMTKEGLSAFEYSPEWLASGFSISPFELPLRSGVFIAKPRPFDGGFGVFDDCLPDGWGLLILDRYLQQQGVNTRTLTLLDRLALVGTAYDLLPSSGMNGFHTTTINDSITPTSDDLIAVALKAGLNRKESLQIFEEMKNKVDSFKK